MARRGRGAGVRMLAAMALATALVACGEGGRASWPLRPWPKATRTLPTCCGSA